MFEIKWVPSLFNSDNNKALLRGNNFSPPEKHNRDWKFHQNLGKKQLKNLKISSKNLERKLVGYSWSQCFFCKWKCYSILQGLLFHGHLKNFPMCTFCNTDHAPFPLCVQIASIAGAEWQFVNRRHGGFGLDHWASPWWRRLHIDSPHFRDICGTTFTLNSLPNMIIRKQPCIFSSSLLKIKQGRLHLSFINNLCYTIYYCTHWI